MNSKYLIALNTLLESHNITLFNFLVLSRREELSEEDLNDLGYLKDKMTIWNEMYDCLLEPLFFMQDFLKIEELLIDENYPKLSKIIIDNKIPFTEIYYSLNTDDFEIKSDVLIINLLELVDYIMGGKYES